MRSLAFGSFASSCELVSFCGAFCKELLPTCADREAAVKRIKPARILCLSLLTTKLGYDDGIVRLQFRVLRGILALNQLLVVHMNPDLGSVRVLPQNVN